MNPIVDAWLQVWDKLTGRRWRHRPDPYIQILPQDILRQSIWSIFYGAIDYNASFRVTADLLRHNRLHPHFHYRHFTKPKKDGSARQLAEPDAKLKKVQYAILKRYLQGEMFHPAALGFRRKKSIADHVWAHAGADLIITADIEDFFPSTTVWRIENWWQNQFPESENAARLLTILTTYQGSLPQGAPTSPALSNLVNIRMDSRLENLVKQSGGRYTRYCDDMVFSWQGYPHVPADFERSARAILRENGYALHPQKGWRVYQRKDEPEITGVILNKHGTVSLPPAMKKLIQEMERRQNPADEARLAGYKGYEKMIEGKNRS
jgi:hypothetical protein